MVNKELFPQVQTTNNINQLWDTRNTTKYLIVYAPRIKVRDPVKGRVLKNCKDMKGYKPW